MCDIYLDFFWTYVNYIYAPSLLFTISMQKKLKDVRSNPHLAEIAISGPCHSDI